MNTYKLFRPLLWTLNAERAHDMALSALARASESPASLRSLARMYTRETPVLAVDILGMSFPNCVGLAAGMDKNGRALPALEALGFGFLEVGTVTPRPQTGNPKPRMWRLPAHKAVINRLGFNNEGADAVAERLEGITPVLSVPLGINIGKNAATPLENSLNDYRTALHRLHASADYVVINISSPNTPGLRSLQHAAALDELLSTMRREVDELDGQREDSVQRTPLLVKIAPDVRAEDLDDMAAACIRHRIDGIIATNTTIRRNGLSGAHATEEGGLSGKPLTDISHGIVAALYRRVGNRIPIVGVGGIMDGEDAYARIKAGATLVQGLTGFVYEGPGFPSRLATELEQLLKRDGLSHVSEAVGIEADRYTEPVNSG